MSSITILASTVATGLLNFLKNNFSLFLAVLLLRCCLGFSLIVVSGSCSQMRCTGFSVRWLPLLWGTGSRCVGHSSCGPGL